MGDTQISLSARAPYADAVVLSLSDGPLKQPPKDAKHIVVIGGGVSGLMTAWILLDKGYRVTILAEHWAWTKDFHNSRLTSQIAGALWEFPPGGCGLTELTNPGSGWAQVKNYEEWALQSFEFYKNLMALHNGRYKAKYGLSMAKLNQFFFKPLPETPDPSSKDPEERKLGEIIKNVNDDRMSGYKRQNQNIVAFLKDIGVGKPYDTELKDAYTHDAPIINTDLAMGELMPLVRNKGADMQTVFLERDAKPLKEKLEELLGSTPDGVINATGLGAGKLFDDKDVFPVRGAIKRIANADHEDFKNLDEAYLVPAQKDPDTEEPTKVVFLVPRSDEILIVGSIIQNHNDQLDLTADSPDVEIMWKRARTFLPALNDAQPIALYPLAEGLRPFSQKNAKVRADTSSDLSLVHNYGHGGSGWTLAVGCARTAIHLLEEIMGGRSPHAANEAIYGKTA